jgi:hypothetical protein
MVQLTVLPAHRAHGGSASAHLPMDTLPAANHDRVAHFHRQLLPAHRCNPHSTQDPIAHRAQVQWKWDGGSAVSGLARWRARKRRTLKRPQTSPEPLDTRASTGN